MSVRDFGVCGLVFGIFFGRCALAADNPAGPEPVAKSAPAPANAAPTPLKGAAKQAPDSVEFLRDIVYGKGGDREMKLNLSRPKNMHGAAPCVVIIHGGGWTGGNRDQMNEVTWDAAKRGYVAATVSYRLAPDSIWPAQIEDVKCAVRFLRANADKYNLDPKRIGAVGFSAGAHLAMLLGATDEKDGLEGTGGWADQSSKVQAVVSYFGPTDLAAPELFGDFSPVMRNFMGGKLSDKPEAFKQASPVSHVSQNSSPMLLFQGTNDLLVNWKQAVRMADALTKYDVDARVELLIGLGHGGWTPAEWKRTADATYAFLEDKFKK